MENKFDCIVIGAGHAGAEAAHATAKLGAKTALITMSKKTIAKMSCNPAIGGLAKGQIAREIDALGGLMGKAIDATGIQFRLLNRSKGPAVQSPRAQADRHKYSDFIRTQLENTPNLEIIEETATEILTENQKVIGISCKDETKYYAPVVILTAGTFLRGLMHIGTDTESGGRIGEPASNKLSESLEKLGLELGRLKTGTPPRLDAETIDYHKLEAQHGDDQPIPFSFMTDSIERKQIPCWITYTNPEIHKLLRDTLDRAPLYTGQIKSIGPRYCPSIESKIVRFADKTRHQVFLEPEEEDVKTIYCNGISTSVPKDVQEKLLKLLPGTENVRIIHYAYAIEYDYCPPVQLKVNLETKKVEGLFLAGQVNGTSGYEEAAAQGLIAGINAVQKLNSKEPIVLTRDQAYIGVLIDDLLTKGIDEPYRMFTSRAEFRLSLRSDNADRRLTPLAKQIGLADNDRIQRFEKKLNDIEKLKTVLQETRTAGQSLWQKLKHTDANAEKTNKTIKQDMLKQGFCEEVIQAVFIDAKYDGYLSKQNKTVQKLRSLEKAVIPADLDSHEILHLKAEAKEKLSAFRPHTLGQASRIGGITPADVMVIQIHLKKHANC